MGREPLETAEVYAQRLARILKSAMPQGWGFLLFLVSFGEKGFTTYVSNCDREDAIRMVEEWLKTVKNETGEGFRDHT